MIKISIIIPVYNAERFLRECLDSVQGQTFGEFEVICVDDASTDGSLSILREYASVDSRFKILEQDNNQFAGVARNIGMAAARGEYLVFWDSDDFFEPDALDCMYRQIEADGADICVCRGRVFNMVTGRLQSSSHYLSLVRMPPEVPFSSREFPNESFLFSNTAPWNKMFRSAFIREKGLQFQAIPKANDVSFVMMAIALSDNITLIDRILVNYRRGATSSLQETNADNPFCFYDALLELRRELREHELFNLFKDGFINLALDQCVYNLNAAKTKEGWLLIALRLKNEILDELECSKYSRYSFVKKRIYEQMKFLMEHTEDELSRFEPELRIDELSAEGIKPSVNDDRDGPVCVSVIVPVYNVEKYLEECIRSVLRQSLRNIEIICVDDGSTDNSPEILADLGREDSRIRIFTQENSGLSVSRNNAMARARGKYVAFLDSDDLLAWCALEHLYLEAEEFSLDELFFSGEGFYDPIGLYKDHPKYFDYYHYKSDYPEALSGQNLFVELRKNYEFKPSVALQFFRRAFLEEARLTFYPGILHEDNLFTIQSLIAAKRAKVLNEPFYLRRVRGDSIITAQGSWNHAYGYLVSVAESRRCLLESQAIDADFKDAVIDFQTEMCASAAKSLRDFRPEEIDGVMSALGEEERMDYAFMLAFGRRRRMMTERYTALNERYNKDVSELRTQIRMERRKANALLREEKQKVKSIENSRSYRIGRFITAPLRLLRKR